MSDDWDRFNSQFAESFDEKRWRQAAQRASLRKEGKCWQCAKLVAECDCPNMTHGRALKAPPA